MWGFGNSGSAARCFRSQPELRLHSQDNRIECEEEQSQTPPDLTSGNQTIFDLCEPKFSVFAWTSAAQILVNLQVSFLWECPLQGSWGCAWASAVCFFPADSCLHCVLTAAAFTAELTTRTQVDICSTTLTYTWTWSPPTEEKHKGSGLSLSAGIRVFPLLSFRISWVLLRKRSKISRSKVCMSGI